MVVGTISRAELPVLKSKVTTLEAKLVKKAAGGSHKIQHTPAFMHAMLMHALTAVACGGDVDPTAVESQGGFTEVGKHPGSQHRDTCWPLVREVLKV
jgi:hypothetical protein